MVSPSKSTLLAVAAAALLLTSGCSGLTLGTPAQSDPPTADVVERYSAIETVTATQVSTLTSDGNTTTSRTRLHLDLAGERRRYSRQFAPPPQAGDRVVVNESVTLVYDASEREATRIPRAESLSSRNRSLYFARVVEAARSDNGTVRPEAGVSPLPVVPATSQAPAVRERNITGYRVAYLGTKSIADRTAHGFRMTAVSDAAMDLNRTLWLDAEHYYPLATNQTMSVGNSTFHVESRLVDVTFDASLGGEAFDTDIPANVTVNTTDLVDARTYETRAALAADVSLSVPEPDLPDGYAFEAARTVTGNYTRVSLRYRHDRGLVSVSKTRMPGDGTGTPTAGENVTVAGHDGRFLATGSAILVSWSCDGYTYSVTATELDREELFEVASSIRCD